MRHRVALLLAAGFLPWAHPGSVRGAAFLVPDHEFRMGSCGAGGPSCQWSCGAGIECAEPGAECALDATQAFAGVLRIQVDDAPCGGADGAVVTIGLAGTKQDGTPFQIRDTVVDLCGHPVPCTGREPRACAPVCGALDDTCFSSDCPPGDVVFMCKDPCSTVDPYFRESDLTGFLVFDWLVNTHQPLLDVTRGELAAVFPAATGRPVIVGQTATQQSLDFLGDPPTGRFCFKGWFLREDKALGVCSNDPTRFCAGSGDCDGGAACDSGAPPDVNPSGPTTRVSVRVCAGGDRLGLPCVDDGDCPPGAACADTGPSVDTGGACEVSGEPCADAGDCPGGEACIFCPTSLCGDGVRDPGETCDDANVVPGDGCDASCQIEGTSVAVVPRKLIVLDKIASAGQAKVVYVAKDPNVTKGAGTDAGGIAATFEVAWDGVSGGFSVPSGAFDGTAGWKTNKPAVAKYVNTDAPSGLTATKVAVVKPGTLLKIVGASLGDAPIDLFAGGPPATPVRTTFTVTNGGDVGRHCSAFDPADPAHVVVFKEIARGAGRKLVAKRGAAAACP